jgi:ABC-2 type transport system permease protein
MLKGLWSLTWLEIKIFVREPLGLIGTIGVPVFLVVWLGYVFGPGTKLEADPSNGLSDGATVPVLASLLIALNAALSLITIIAVYREGGILKRLRATPLRSHTILTAHVLVKLLLTAVTLGLTMLAGARSYPVAFDMRLLGFAAALSISTTSLLSIGFLIASIVPTARLAQPIGSMLLYPMLGVCGLFTPVSALPPGMQSVAHVVPLTYAVSLLRGAWLGEPWSAHLGDIAALVLIFGMCTALSARVFRWE